MRPFQPKPEQVRTQLERLLDHPDFRGPKLGGLLRFLVDQWLLDGGKELTEKFIGESVADEPLTLEPNLNKWGYPRTRANLGHVRKRLRLYYETAGHGDLVVIRLERGSYAPLIAYNVVLGTVQEVGPERIAEALDVLYAVLRKLLRSDLSAS